MVSPGYVVGLDGGGTKTAAMVLWPDDSQRTVSFGPLNLNGATQETVAQTLADLCDFLSKLPGGLAGCGSLCIGCAGISNPVVSTFLRQQLQQLGFRGTLTLVGDHEAAWAGAHRGQDGIALIAGTGSICYGRAGGQTARSGGFGHLIDDEGSGYAIGRDILAAVVRAQDGRIAPTQLTPAVFSMLSLADMGELVRFVYSPHTHKAQIAALTPLLDDALAAGDGAALAIAEKCARELALLVEAVAHQLGMTRAPVAFLGSILQKQPVIAQRTRQLLQQSSPGLEVRLPLADAAMGAALLARGAVV